MEIVRLEGQNLTEEHWNTLEHITLEGTKLKIKARFSSHEVDLRKLEPKEINQVKDSIVRQNFDNRFGIKFTSPTD